MKRKPTDPVADATSTACVHEGTITALDDISDLPLAPTTPSKLGSKTKVLTNYCKITRISARYIHAYSIRITDVGVKDMVQLTTAERAQILAKAHAESELYRDRYMFFDGGAHVYTTDNLFPNNSNSNSDDDNKSILLATRIKVGSVNPQEHPFEVRLMATNQKVFDLKLIERHCSGSRAQSLAYTAECLSILNRVFRRSAVERSLVLSNKKTATNRTLYISDFGKVTTDVGFDIYWGIQQTVKATSNGLYLALGTRVLPMISAQTALDFIQHFFQNCTLDELYDKDSKAWMKAAQAISGLRAESPDGRTIWITGISEEPAASLKTNDGAPLTERYALAHADLPCVLTALGTPIPLETCRLVSGQMADRVSTWQRDKLYSLGSPTPESRKTLLDNAIRTLDFVHNRDLAALGIKVKPRLASLRARKLDAPQVRFADSSQAPVATPIGGSWDMRGRKVDSAVAIHSWAIVSFAHALTRPAIRAFASQLIKTSLELGIRIHGTDPVIRFADRNAPIAGELEETVRAGEAIMGGVELVVCILPNSASARYGEIKRIATTRLGVTTQCVLAKNVRAHNPTLARMLALKINTKLGGRTMHVADVPCLSGAPTMVVSADVNHDTEAGGMSVAAVVSSVDERASAFRGTVVQHPHHTEVIENLDEFVRVALRVFYKSTGGVKPKRIVYYRDGVRDSLVPVIKRVEIDAFYKACASIEPGYRPALTVVLVNKRHGARFMAGDVNCDPGTLVDRDVVAPGVFDFYLLSHTTRVPGTAKPPHYVVVHDDSGFGPDDVYRMTFALAHMYHINCKSIIMPASLYYAHRLSGFGRFCLNERFDDLPRFGGKGGVEYFLVPVHKNIQDKMYFM